MRPMAGFGSDDVLALMRSIAAGDEEALRRFAERHLPRIMAHARQMLRHEAEAEDVAQEALVRVWRHAARWSPEQAKLTTWLYTIVHRLCLDRLRRPQALPADLVAERVDPAASALDGLVARSEAATLGAALAALPARQRAAITLFYYDELAGNDAATVLGLSERAFWSLLHRARERLERALRRADACPGGGS